MRRLLHIIIVIAGCGLAAALGAGIFVWSGIYDIAALRPHLPVTSTFLRTLKHRAVSFHAKNIQLPDLFEPGLVRRGFVLYREQCLDCHGAPGTARSRMGVGLNPVPPPLVKAAERFNANEIAWVIANGLKMAGMPAFSFGESSDDLFALTSFVMRMNNLSPDEYQMMERFAADVASDETGLWVLKTRRTTGDTVRGDVKKGRYLAGYYGCAECHVIPGVKGAQTSVGPPLTSWSKQQYISGKLVNTPKNLVNWLVDPASVEPDTAMPDLDLSVEEAWHIAAFLFSEQ